MNEVENGRRSPSLGTYEKLRTTLGLGTPAALALLPTAVPQPAGEQFLTTLAVAVLLTRQVALADLATALQVGVPKVRAGTQELTGRLAAVGLAVADDGVTVELTVLAYAAEPVGRVGQLEALRALTPEAVMTMVIIGHLGEAPGVMWTSVAAPTAPELDRLAPTVWWTGAPNAPAPACRTPTGSRPGH